MTGVKLSLIVALACGLAPQEVLGQQAAQVFPSSSGSSAAPQSAPCPQNVVGLEGSFFSVRASNGREYQRYVIREGEGVQGGWQVVQGVRDLTHCANEASLQDNALMFKFSGNTCQLMFDAAYNLRATPACGADMTDLAYVLTSAKVPCPFPSVTIKHDPSITACAGRVLTKIRSVDEGQALCRSTYPHATVTTLYFDAVPQTTNTSEVQAHFARLGYKTEKLLVAADSSSGQWEWTLPKDTTNVPPAREMDPALVAGLPTASQGFSMLFMNPDKNFALEATREGTVFDGAMCCIVDLRQ